MIVLFYLYIIVFWRGTTVETGLVLPEKGCSGGTG